MVECVGQTAGIVTTIQDDHRNLEATLTQQQGHVTSQRESQVSWSDSMSTELGNRKNEVDNFLANELKQDIPTGNFSLVR